MVIDVIWGDLYVRSYFNVWGVEQNQMNKPLFINGRRIQDYKNAEYCTEKHMNGPKD